MAQYKFMIGEKEQHEVEVHTPVLFWQKFSVKVDGKAVVDKHKLLKTSEKIHTEIGDKETHKVEIEINWPWLGWKGSKINVLVDGKPKIPDEEKGGMNKKVIAGIGIIAAIWIIGVALTIQDGGEGLSPVEEWSTYTSSEYGFSIEYPEDWAVKEDYKGTVVAFRGPEKGGGFINANVGASAEVPTGMTLEEFVEASREELSEDINVVETFTDTINGEPAAGHILTWTREGGGEAKAIQVIFVRGTTGYAIILGSTASVYDDAYDYYFDPMIQSFELTD